MAVGGLEAVLTARTRCRWGKFMECGELLYGKICPLRLNGAVYVSYVKPAILYGSEDWCLEESEMQILQLKDRKRAMDLMLGLNETLDQVDMANSVCWCDHVLGREDRHVLRRVLEFEGEKKWGFKEGAGW